MAAGDLKETHAQEFTDIERLTLRLWFDLDSAGNDQLADSLLNAGLQLEHYTSLLADDPGQRTSAQLAAQQLLAFRLSDQVSQAEAFLGRAHTGPGTVIGQFRELTRKIIDDSIRISPPG